MPGGPSPSSTESTIERRANRASDVLPPIARRSRRADSGSDVTSPASNLNVNLRSCARDHFLKKISTVPADAQLELVPVIWRAENGGNAGLWLRKSNCAVLNYEPPVA